ncbi:DsrE family protein [Natrinema amylolyticum]|uniref:DsrE family protein n=1 Tax=Natrinema amylolyticum TaxID=2878679 RepID=UPI001CFC05C5|nr:DsrE family protein [Natrinema amylolyticum]
MVDAAVIILAGTESQADTGRLVNGLEAAREFAETAGDDLALIFDGAGTQWIEELEDEDHEYHDLYRSVRDEVAVCDYCAGAFGADEAVDDAGLVRVDENEGHPSVRSLVDDGYDVLTF